MRLLLALTLVSVLSTTAAAQSGLGNPFTDKDAAKFFDAWPLAKATIVADGLDDLVLPGGSACEVPDYPDTNGSSTVLLSPDQKSLVILSTARLTRKTAKALKLAASSEVAYFAMVFDGATGAMWTKVLEGEACRFLDATALWSPDNTRVFLVESFGERTMMDDQRVVLLDLAAKKIRMQGAIFIAELVGVDHEVPTYSDAVFTGKTRVTLCVTRPPEAKAAPLQYRFDEEYADVTKLGACPAKKAAPATTAPATAPAKPAPTAPTATAPAPAKPAPTAPTTPPASAPAKSAPAVPVAPAPAKPAPAK